MESRELPTARVQAWHWMISRCYANWLSGVLRWLVWHLTLIGSCSSAYTTGNFGNLRVSHSYVLFSSCVESSLSSRFYQLSQELCYVNGTIYDQLLILNDKFEVDKTLLEEKRLVRSCSHHSYSLIDNFLAVLCGNMGGSTSLNEFSNECYLLSSLDLWHEKDLGLDFTFWNQTDLPAFQLAILERWQYAWWAGQGWAARPTLQGNVQSQCLWRLFFIVTRERLVFRCA